jgi:hypothetical protein
MSAAVRFIGATSLQDGAAMWINPTHVEACRTWHKVAGVLECDHGAG